MSQTTVLVIDDSATIRKMVDSHLSQVGYRVVLAANAEDGLELAQKIQPHLILLDHQLPGTTGLEICRKLLEIPQCSRTPVVVTSTLRKRAYMEYTDMPNVVDSLPKPFTPDLLKTTLANALETGAMVVASQNEGSAIPEVIESLAEIALSGSFRWISLRELFDFLNNGNKQGMLEVELEHDRIWFYLEKGHIQSVVSATVDAQEVAATLPAALTDLAALLKFTLGGAFSAQADGLVELLDKKVLDPRMLRSLLRHQAAALTWRCFTARAKNFSFDAQRTAPALFRKIPLDISLAALLVEAAQVCPEKELPASDESVVYARRAVRGQSLDRTGLSAQHMQMLTYLETPLALQPLAQRAQMPPGELRRVLHGFELAEWVQTQTQSTALQVLALESEASGAELLRELFSRDDQPYRGRVVKDRLSLQLLLKRTLPDVVFLSMDTQEERTFAARLQASKECKHTRFVGIVAAEANQGDTKQAFNAMKFNGVLERPYLEEDVHAVLDQLFKQNDSEASKSVDLTVAAVG